MDFLMIIGAFAGLLAIFALVLWLDDSPLDQAIKSAQEWENNQKKLSKALERSE